MKDDQSEEFYKWERTLYWILSLILSQWKRFKNSRPMIKGSIYDFETGIIRRSIKCDQRRRVCRTIAFKTKKRMKIWRMTRVKSFVSERTLYWILSLILSQWKFKNRRNVMQFIGVWVTTRASAFRTSCRRLVWVESDEMYNMCTVINTSC